MDEKNLQQAVTSHPEVGTGHESVSTLAGSELSLGESESNEFNDTQDELGPLEPPRNFCGLDPELAREIMLAKQNNPSQFASHWEMDELDVDEATEEEIQNDPGTRMLWAAEKNQEDVVKELISLDRDLVNAKDSDLYSPLHRAAYENHPNIVQLLLENEADINALTIDGWTALHSACHWNNFEAARMLISYSADVNSITTQSGLTPLHLAASCQTEERQLLELLLFNKTLNPYIRDSTGLHAKEFCERSNKFSYLFDIVEDSICKLYAD